jgi:hypothetical protein
MIAEVTFKTDDIDLVRQFIDGQAEPKENISFLGVKWTVVTYQSVFQHHFGRWSHTIELRGREDLEGNKDASKSS